MSREHPILQPCWHGDASGEQRLWAALKVLLRHHGLRCVQCRPMAPPEGEPLQPGSNSSGYGIEIGPCTTR